ncbi:MAG: hypothetical protein IJ825_08095 [Oscillospiraceae bacterium]|nr:hypothetical protein [Oscillospiraceae bacterium]
MKNAMTKMGNMGFAAKKKIAGILAALALSASSLTSVAAFATGGSSGADANLQEVANPIIDLVNQVFNVLIPVVGAIGAVYCIFLGIKFAKAEEPQEREKAKTHLKNAIIGFVLIFVLVGALRIAVPNLSTWMDAASGN